MRLRQVTGLCVQPAGLDTLLEYRGAGFNALGLERCSASLGMLITASGLCKGHVLCAILLSSSPLPAFFP